MAADNAILAVLESIPALSHLSADIRERLAGVVREQDFAKGEVLLHEHDTTRDTYLIVDGLCEVWSKGEKIDESGPGDIDGEIALLYRTPRSATVKAASDVRALVLPADAFDEIAAADPKAATAIRGAMEFHLRNRFG
jgi:CRP-like cAMP-binding protein